MTYHPYFYHLILWKINAAMKHKTFSELIFRSSFIKRRKPTGLHGIVLKVQFICMAYINLQSTAIHLTLQVQNWILCFSDRRFIMKAAGGEDLLEKRVEIAFALRSFRCDPRE